VSGIRLAFQGFNLDYERNGSKNMVDSMRREYWCYLENGKWNDYVATAKYYRGAVCYNPDIRKVVIVFTYGNADDLRKAARKIGCIHNGNTYGIGLDSGSKAALCVNGKVKINGGGELLHILTF
jgi:hypothetical protein